MRLTVSIATRGRPALLAETLRGYLGGTVLPDTRIHVAIDADDEATLSQRDKLPGGGKVIYSIKPREDTRGLKHQRVLTEAPADLYLVGVDTTPVVSMGWDQSFLDAAAIFPDGIGVVSTPMANATFPYLQAVTARWVELTGWVQPPYYPYWFIDHWTDDLAKMTGRYVMADVEAHSTKHPGKTIGMRDLPFWAAYYTALHGERIDQANRIIDAIEEPAWRKAMLRSNFQRVAVWSQYLNDRLIARGPDVERDRADAGPVPAGYMRAKNAALARLNRMIETEAA